MNEKEILEMIDSVDNNSDLINVIDQVYNEGPEWIATIIDATALSAIAFIVDPTDHLGLLDILGKIIDKKKDDDLVIEEIERLEKLVPFRSKRRSSVEWKAQDAFIYMLRDYSPPWETALEAIGMYQFEREKGYDPIAAYRLADEAIIRVKDEITENIVSSIEYRQARARKREKPTPVKLVHPVISSKINDNIVEVVVYCADSIKNELADELDDFGQVIPVSMGVKLRFNANIWDQEEILDHINNLFPLQELRE